MRFHLTVEEATELGYNNVRLLPTGQLAGLHSFMFTVGVVVGLSQLGYKVRYCYASAVEALAALNEWNGSGDPPGPWIKRKGADTPDKLGPGALS